MHLVFSKYPRLALLTDTEIDSYAFYEGLNKLRAKTLFSGYLNDLIAYLELKEDNFSTGASFMHDEKISVPI